MSFFLADIGGTKIRLIFCKSEKDLKQQKLEIFLTPQNYRQFLKLLKNFADANSHFLKKIRKAVFGFAGVFNARKEKLIYAPNLKDYENRNLKKDLERILNCKVILENDAALAGIGEAKFGAGKIFDVFGYLTLSTGVGGAKIVRISSRETSLSACELTRMDANSFGFEPGHSFLLMNNFLFEAEELLGGESIKKFFGKKPENIKNKKFWNYYHQILSIFLINVSIFWSVDKIILGGGITKSLDFKNLNFLVNKFHPLPLKIKIIKAKLGELAVLWGGLVIILKQ